MPPSALPLFTQQRGLRAQNQFSKAGLWRAS